MPMIRISTLQSGYHCEECGSPIPAQEVLVFELRHGEGRVPDRCASCSLDDDDQPITRAQLGLPSAELRG